MRRMAGFVAKIMAGALLLGLIGCGGGGGGGPAIALLPAELIVAVGGGGALFVSNPPGGATQVSSWTSSDESVATVAASDTWTATVTGVAPGVVTITATVGSATATATVTVVVDTLSQATLEQLASFLTTKAEAGLVSTTSTIKPVSLEPTEALVNAMAADLGPGRMVAFAVDPAVFDTAPVVIEPGDLTVAAVRTRGTATPDPQIAQGVDTILDKMEELGMDTTALRNAFNDTDFHQSGAQAGGATVSATAQAVTFIPGALGFWLYWYNGQAILVYDNDSHTVLKPADAQNLRDGNIIQNNQLTESSSTVLHEMMHTMIAQTDCGPDDDEDQLVSALEHALKSKIDAELSRQATGSPDPNRIKDYSNFVREVQDLGGEECLKTLGLPGSAKNLVVNCPSSVPVNQTFTVSISVQKTDDTALANEDVYIRVSGDAVGADFDRVVRTDGQGRASIQVTAGSEPGEIGIRVRVLGETQAPTVQVVAQQVSYGTSIQPIFTSRCVSCHDPATFNEGGLDLRSYQGLMAGGNSGAEVIPGAASDSRLVARIEGTITPQMPLGQTPLSDSQIQSIRTWIDQGALNN